MPLIEPSSRHGNGLSHDTESNIALSVVILNWNARAYLVDALRSITEKQWRHSIEVIVVDNNSNLDDSVATVQRDFPPVHLLALSANIGFSAGNNAGLRLARPG